MISLIINTLNEEDNIGKCIESATDYVDEIVVCDMHSDDQTVQIAKSYGARILYHERTGFVEPARHYAISSASNPWVLVLDADERMNNVLGHKLREIVHDGTVDVVEIWSLNYFFGKAINHGGFSHKKPRFFKLAVYTKIFEEESVENANLIHQHLPLLKKHNNTLKLPKKYYFQHYAYPTITKYIYKTIGKYAKIEAQQYFAQGMRFSIFNSIFDPFLSFLKRYIFKLGFIDRTHGLILCVMFAWYRYSVWIHLWFLHQNSERDETK